MYTVGLDDVRLCLVGLGFVKVLFVEVRFVWLTFRQIRFCWVRFFRFGRSCVVQLVKKGSLKSTIFNVSSKAN